MDFRSAAAIPEVWLTAFQLLHLVGKLEASDIVLIHAAGSGVGTAAIQLARFAGAKVIAVAGDDKKLEFATRLGAQHTINYKSVETQTLILFLCRSDFTLPRHVYVLSRVEHSLSSQAASRLLLVEKERPLFLTLWGVASGARMQRRQPWMRDGSSMDQWAAEA